MAFVAGSGASGDAGEGLEASLRRHFGDRKPELLVTIGVDLGQRRDPTAIAVLTQLWATPAPASVDRGALGTWLEPGRAQEQWIARHLERLPLGTPYPQVARRIAEVARGAADRTSLGVTVYIDATGLGQPVVDVLAETGMTAYAGIVPVYFTHGDKLARDAATGSLRLGKAYLVSRLQAILEGGRLYLPDTREAHQLRESCGTTRSRSTRAGTTSTGRSGPGPTTIS